MDCVHIWITYISGLSFIKTQYPIYRHSRKTVLCGRLHILLYLRSYVLYPGEKMTLCDERTS